MNNERHTRVWASWLNRAGGHGKGDGAARARWR
jgi:hypothetical protein